VPTEEQTTSPGPDPPIRLQDGEQVTLALRRTSWVATFAKFATLGLFVPWWKAGWFVLTDRRLIVKYGILNKSEIALPLHFVQDASVHRSWLGVGRVLVSTAGGEYSNLRLYPLKAADARGLADTIILQAERVGLDQRSSSPCGATREGRLDRGRVRAAEGAAPRVRVLSGADRAKPAPRRAILSHQPRAAGRLGERRFRSPKRLPIPDKAGPSARAVGLGRIRRIVICRRQERRTSPTVARASLPCLHAEHLCVLASGPRGRSGGAWAHAMGPSRSVSPAGSSGPLAWGGPWTPPVPEYGRLNMRVRLIFAALAVGALLPAGCGSTPSHRPAAREPREQVVTVTGAIGPPESPKEKQFARELRGVKGESPPQVVTVTGAIGPPESPKEKQLARELSGVNGKSP
jgi:Bacterial PH domain